MGLEFDQPGEIICFECKLPSFKCAAIVVFCTFMAS